MCRIRDLRLEKGTHIENLVDLNYLKMPHLRDLYFHANHCYPPPGEESPFIFALLQLLKALPLLWKTNIPVLSLTCKVASCLVYLQQLESLTTNTNAGYGLPNPNAVPWLELPCLEVSRHVHAVPTRVATFRSTPCLLYPSECEDP